MVEFVAPTALMTDFAGGKVIATIKDDGTVEYCFHPGSGESLGCGARFQNVDFLEIYQLELMLEKARKYAPHTEDGNSVIPSKYSPNNLNPDEMNDSVWIED